jgi:periplasmic divalent cation tolerance protein
MILLVLSTFPDTARAESIGTQLVERGLAACVNVLPGVISIYHWQGAVQRDAEVLAIFKISAAAWPSFEPALRELHPYEVPEIVALEPAHVSQAYADWVLGNSAATEHGLESACAQAPDHRPGSLTPQ